MASIILSPRATITYTPADSTWLATCLLQGTIAASVAYGIVFTLHFSCMYMLLSEHHPRRYRLMAYNGIIFVLATAAFALQDRWNHKIFIHYDGYPGGPAKYFMDHVDDWLNVASMAIQIIMNWLVDLLVLHQFWITQRNKLTHHSGARYERWLICLPATMLFTSVGLGCAFLAQLSRNGLSIYSTASTALAVCYTAVSVAHNVITTGLIILEIRRVGRASNRTDGGYLSAFIEVLVESAALYTVIATIFIILYGVDSLLANALAPLLRQIQAICPLLISSRAALQRDRRLRSLSSQQSMNIRPMPRLLDTGAQDSSRDHDAKFSSEKGAIRLPFTVSRPRYARRMKTLPSLPKLVVERPRTDCTPSATPVHSTPRDSCCKCSFANASPMMNTPSTYGDSESPYSASPNPLPSRLRPPLPCHSPMAQTSYGSSDAYRTYAGSAPWSPFDSKCSLASSRNPNTDCSPDRSYGDGVSLHNIDSVIDIDHVC
ncbi:hypothetical protein OE88DRAFT_1665682 [Heliocybe sulcata]|uniref:Uncharacterized protein n=1 Tax=Heliocybe sulcata TaxID=5364 RepID=A0A5C3MRM1_9AGAM|nr:hypothetical protein OE88DRAFT_1665682 [Heliocybe sulcata]